MTGATFYEYNFPLQQTSKFVAPLCTFGKVILLSYKTILLLYVRLSDLFYSSSDCTVLAVENKV